MPLPVSVIISTYNNPNALACIVQRLLEGTQLPSEIVIADDGSTADTRETIDRLSSQRKIPIHHCWHPDKGFRKAPILNASVARTTGDYLLFLDGDCLPHRSWVADHQKLAQRNYFVQGRRAFIRQENVPEILDGRSNTNALFWRMKLGGAFKAIRLPWPLIKRNREMYGLLGCNLAVWRDDLVAINGFDEAYEGWGIEDSDLGARLYNLGHKRKFVHGRALVFHLDHPELNKDHLPESLARLKETIELGKTRCEHGLDQHTADTT
jgi:glycosyltransferase involved in cell wall biosynthesis